MKKLFQVMACTGVLICAAYGAYVLVKKFFLCQKYKETTEFDDLYDEYMSSQKL